jgi:ATP/maltotriose-dependent transcriptional regulator MalT
MAADSATSEHAISLGWQAMSSRSWHDARIHFESAVAREESPDGLEGLGWAAYWLNDIELSFTSWNGAYRRFVERQDRHGAARTAVWLASNHFLRRGEYAVARGWVRRANRWLEGLEPCQEHAIVAVWEAYTSIIADHDTVRARQLSTHAAFLARDQGAFDIEMLAQAIDGFARVNDGDVDEGMRLLDEATAAATSGEMSDLEMISVTCCFLIYACARVGDFDRAAQWCNIVLSISDRWSYRAMFAMCRSHLAELHMWRGDWRRAETELLEAYHELMALFPAMAYEGALRLAELRRRQGQFDEAAAFYDQAERDPLRMLSVRGVLIGRAALALEQGDARVAVEFADRFLRSLQGPNCLERVLALEVLVRAHVALGERTEAANALGQLQQIAASTPTPALRAAAKSADGILAAANGEHEVARQRFEDAIDLYAECGLPYEGALCRLRLATTLVELRRPDRAVEEAASAHEALIRMGAERDAERAAALAGRSNADRSSVASTGKPRRILTNRETEILRLVANGLGTKEIAAQLRLSEHTVHRHIANILNKLDVPSRAAAVARAAQDIQL